MHLHLDLVVLSYYKLVTVQVVVLEVYLFQLELLLQQHLEVLCYKIKMLQLLLVVQLIYQQEVALNKTVVLSTLQVVHRTLVQVAVLIF